MSLPNPPTEPTPANQPPVFVSPRGAPRPPTGRRSAGRRFAIVLGVLAALFGAVLAAAGGGILALVGSDGVVSTGRGTLSTSTSALVSEAASIKDTAGVADAFGDTRLKISARGTGGRPVFVGVGRSADVERYLAGASFDEVTDFDALPFRVDQRRHAGTGAAAAPTAQDFWVARARGSQADVTWKVRDGDYRVVVMKADGSRGIATRSSVGVDIPYLPGIGAGILVAGVLIL